MAALMEALRREHADMTVLLDLMDQQIVQFQEGATPDFNLVRGIISYFLTYPDLYHHPKEDLIAARLRKRAPDQAASLESLLNGHLDLAYLTRRLATATVDQMVRPDDEPREWFSSLGRDFVDSNRRHMAMEEAHFFPLALKVLSDGDWAELDGRFAAGTMESHVRALHGAVLDQIAGE